MIGTTTRKPMIVPSIACTADRPAPVTLVRSTEIEPSTAQKA